jgi:hypothetical protein
MPPSDFQAMVAPALPLTWEAIGTLRNTQQDTGRIPVNFGKAVFLGAVYPSVARAGAGLAVPSLDDLLVFVDLNGSQRYTSRFDENTPAGSTGGNQVTLGSYRDTLGGARMLNLEIRENSPILNVTFAWKRPIAGGPYFCDVFVGVAFHCRDL